MQRRTYLAAVAAALGATAGCTGGAGDAASPTESESATETPTPTPPPPTPAQPQVTDYGLEPRENCDQRGSASISVDGQDVIIEGCIVGKDGCQEAVLDSVAYEADELTVRVATEKREGAEACTQQLVDLAYTATVTFENGLPGTTRLIHDGAEGEREAGTADTN
jgi:hypothetical protein